MKKTFIVVLLITSVAVSFFFGVNLTKSGIARSVERMQASLSFSHLQVYRNLQSDFLSGCKSRLESRLEQIIDEQNMRMAEYVQNTNDKSFEDYINLRDDNLINELRSYEVDWKKTWTLPDCKIKETVK